MSPSGVPKPTEYWERKEYQEHIHDLTEKLDAETARAEKAEAGEAKAWQAWSVAQDGRTKAEAKLAAFVDYFDTWDISPPQLTRLLNELRAAGRDSGGQKR